MIRIFKSIVDWHLDRFEFQTSIKSMSSSLVKGSMLVYQWAVDNLLPTPAKTHYTFNLRDFARVIQGVVLSHPSEFASQSKMIRLWVHEVFRVYYDRLIADDDRSALYKFTIKQVQETFESDENTVFSKVATGDGGKLLLEDDLRSVMFGDFLANRVAGVENKYSELDSFEKITEKCKVELNEYNQVKKSKLNLVLFRFAIEHISKISRILKLPGGNALLVGVGGSGRQSLALLSAFINKYEVFQIEISKQYGKNEWREDLKKLLLMAGRDNTKTVFLFPGKILSVNILR